MKKLAVLILVLILFTGIGSLSAQEIPQETLDAMVTSLGEDFSTFLESLGSDLTPLLLQNAVVGQNIGIAELGDSVFYFNIVPVIGATAGSGLLSNRNIPADEYSGLINLDATIAGMAEGALGPELTTLFLDNLTPIPSLKLNIGAKLPADLELLVTGFWIPDFLLPAVADMVGVPELKSFELSALNVGGMLRYPLLKDSEESPGLSIAAGYFYDSFHAGVLLGSLLGSDGSLPEGLIDSTAKMSIDTGVHAFGTELTLSKKLLFFAPYLKLGAWYGISSFSGTVNLTTDTVITGGKAINDFAFLAGTGFDLLFGPFCMNFAANYNLGSGVFGASFGMRLQF